MIIDVRKQEERFLEIRAIPRGVIKSLAKEVIMSLDDSNPVCEKSFLLKDISGFVDADLCGVEYRRLNRAYKRQLAGKSTKFNEMVVAAILRKLIKGVVKEKPFFDANEINCIINENNELSVRFDFHFLPKSIEKYNDCGEKYFNVLGDFSINISVNMNTEEL